jgi:hypothetical protein
MRYTIALICSLLFIPLSSLALESSSHSSEATLTDNCKIEPENGEFFDEKQMQSIASRITVRVMGDNNGGSGTVIAKQKNTYLVLTNAHVIRDVKSIRLQTSDGKTYPAQMIPQANFDKYDIALLTFESKQNYCQAPITQAIPKTGTPVIASGFSIAKGEIVFRSGKVEQIPQRPLKEGYTIGYTSDIEQGMSGSAIVNSLGILIGINGRSAYPILNTGYTYGDGSRPTPEEIKKMRTMSWGIPVTTVLAQANPEILTAYSLPLPKTTASVPTAPLPGWLGELEHKAKQITVKIDSTSGANGSGVVINM